MPVEANEDGSAALWVLGQRVRAARLAAGLSIDAAAEQAGMSPVTWGRVEKGETVRALTYTAVEKILRWQHGSVDAILQGGQPSQLDAAADTTTQGQQYDDTAVAILRVIATVLSSNLPDSMKVRLIAREIAAVEDILAGSTQGTDADEDRATG